MRIMAIDYGDAHTGVAISDPTGLLAGTTTTIHSRKDQVVLEELRRLIEQYQVDELVMGFPRNMDGTEGPRAQLYRDFARQVEEATGRCGTSGAPPSTPTASSLTRGRTPKSGKRRWTRWPPP